MLGARLKYLFCLAPPTFGLFLLFGSPPIATASGDDCVASEASVYVAIRDASGTAIDLFCGSSLRPAARIAIPTGYAAVSVNRDRAGRLYVMEQDPRDQDIRIFQTYFNRNWSSELRIDLAPRAMLVDRNRALAYIYRAGAYYSPKPPQITIIDGVRALVERSFQTGTGSPAPLVQPLIDRGGRILMRGDDGFVDAVNPTSGAVVNRIHASPCAMTTGNDSLMYTIDCLGEVRAFEGTSFRPVASWSVTSGNLFRNAVLPAIAVDSKGILFLANTNTNRLEFYRPRDKMPFSTEELLLLQGMRLDVANNLYILGSPNDRYRSFELDVYRDDGSRVARYSFPSRVYPIAMSVDP